MCDGGSSCWEESHGQGMGRQWRFGWWLVKGGNAARGGAIRWVGGRGVVQLGECLGSQSGRVQMILLAGEQLGGHEKASTVL